MAEYIDREKVLAIIEPKYWITLNGKIKQIPAADVVPVVHARWKQVEVKEYRPYAIASMFCPVCKRYHNEVYYYGDPRHNVNYCPFCGAKMDKKTNSEKAVE